MEVVPLDRVAGAMSTSSWVYSAGALRTRHETTAAALSAEVFG